MGCHFFETVQATWNLLEPSAGPALSEAHAAGMGVIVKEALANGRLTSRNPDPGFAPKLAILEQEAARFDSSVEAIALASCLDPAICRRGPERSGYGGTGAIKREKLPGAPRCRCDAQVNGARRTISVLLGNAKKSFMELSK